jgi:hypothetical protein
MRHRVAHTSRFPTRLLFAAVCPALRQAGVGLALDGTSRRECAGYPIVAGLYSFDFPCLKSTRFSVNCQSDEISALTMLPLESG